MSSPLECGLCEHRGSDTVQVQDLALSNKQLTLGIQPWCCEEVPGHTGGQVGIVADRSCWGPSQQATFTTRHM